MEGEDGEKEGEGGNAEGGGYCRLLLVPDCDWIEAEAGGCGIKGEGRKARKGFGEGMDYCRPRPHGRHTKYEALSVPDEKRSAC